MSGKRQSGLPRKLGIKEGLKFDMHPRLSLVQFDRNARTTQDARRKRDNRHNLMHSWQR